MVEKFVLADLVIDAAGSQPEQSCGLRLIVARPKHRGLDDLALAFEQTFAEVPVALFADADRER